MKKILSLICVFVLMVFSFSACSALDEKVSNSETTEQTMTDYEMATENLCRSIRGTLKNPNSLIINGVICYELNDAAREYFDSQIGNQDINYMWNSSQYLCAVDFSAENSFGGMGRETHYYYYSNAGFKEDSSAYVEVLIGYFEMYFQEQYRSIDISKLNY